MSPQIKGWLNCPNCNKTRGGLYRIPVGDGHIAVCDVCVTSLGYRDVVDSANPQLLAIKMATSPRPNTV
jgi:hypothetical protein